jgi:hypothetical protein
MPTRLLESSQDRNRRARRYQSALAETILARYKAEFVRRNEPELMAEGLELAATEGIAFL